MKSSMNGVIFEIDYQMRSNCIGSGCENMSVHVGTISLKIDSVEALHKIVPPPNNGGDYNMPYELSYDQLQRLRPLMVTPPQLDFERYEYFLCQQNEEWLQRKLQEEEDRLIPDPKSVFALEILEKGEKYGDGRIMPIFEIDTDDVRTYFDMPEPDNFCFEDRLDAHMLDFIMQRAKCNNINIELYDYRPAIWQNVFCDGEIEIVPCNNSED